MMADQKPTPRSREDIAEIEIGETAIGRRTALALVLFFLLTIVSVPVAQRVLDRRAGEPGVLAILSAPPEAAKALRDPAGGSWWRRLSAANAVLLERIHTYKTTLEDDSFVAKAAIPRMQLETARFLGLGNEQAYLGRDGWLFYRPGVDYLTGPGFLDPRRLRARVLESPPGEAPVQPDPRAAILDFKRQLDARGITLVVMPEPVKPVIRPDRLSSSFGPGDAPLENPSYRAFIGGLRASGVKVFDPTDTLMREAGKSGEDVFLKTDTHWRPEAMEAVAAALAKFLREEVALPAGDTRFRVEPATVTNHGDIAIMLKLPARQTLFPAESVALRVVLTPGGEFWRPSHSADILLLGDSFSNIYSLGEMNWGESAGFAEQLSLETARPVDTLLRNDAGAYATREMLARELARGHDRLAGKKVVVWEFAARELAVGDWKRIGLTLGKASAGTFYSPADGAPPVRATGTIEEISSIPRPGSVPYKDHICALHLSGLEGEGVPDGAQAMVYVRSMTDGVLTSAARFRAGERVTLDLVSWNDVSDRYERFNRSELDDESLQAEPPCWGEPIKRSHP